MSCDERGCTSAVVLSEYQRLLDELDLLRNIRTALRQVEQSEAVPHREASAGLWRASRLKVVWSSLAIQRAVEQAP